MKKLLYCLSLLLFIPCIGNSQLIEEKNKNEEVFTIVEQMPEFPGGQSELFVFLGNHIVYPAEAKAKGIQGKVYVNFTVGKDGLIRDIKVIRGVHPLLDNETVRVVGVMPLWKPGTQRGKKVNVSFNLPINFTLDTTSKKSKSNSESSDEKKKDKKRGKDKKKAVPSNSKENSKGKKTIIS